MSKIPTLEEYGLTASDYSDLKGEISALELQKEKYTTENNLFEKKSEISLWLLTILISFILMYFYLDSSLWEAIFTALAASIMLYVYLVIHLYKFFANVISLGRYKENEKQVSNIDQLKSKVEQNACKEVGPFETALYDYYKEKADQFYNDKLYKKHSGTPIFNAALVEFESMVEDCLSVNDILMTKHFDFWEYKDYIRKRKKDHEYNSIGHSIKKDGELEHFIENIRRGRVKKILEVPEKTYHTPRKIDWDKVNINRKETGELGEEIALSKEKEYLVSVGRNDLANKIRHMSKEQGDGLGYDILSFFRDGRERYIEVKATTGSIETPFYLSRGEFSLIEEKTDSIFIYRIALPSGQNNDEAELKIYTGEEVLNVGQITPVNYLVKI